MTFKIWDVAWNKISNYNNNAKSERLFIVTYEYSIKIYFVQFINRGVCHTFVNKLSLKTILVPFDFTRDNLGKGATCYSSNGPKIALAF